jgi:site-specific DNA-methyltransferase (adenine-specific)
MQLFNGDCLNIMKQIPDRSIDMILCDLPYGTTSCKWDTPLPFDDLWNHYRRIIKPNCAICLFGSEPFSSVLRMSNIKEFKYDWIWEKSKSGSAFTAKYRPVCKHETISVFSLNGKRTQYYPIMESGEPYHRTHKISECDVNNHGIGFNRREVESINDGFRYPTTILRFQQKWRRQDQMHPTQKPVALCEYLIKTYTQEGMTVLDNCMGSGTTGVACVNTGRDFIGIEKDEHYFEVAKKRIGSILTKQPES